MRYATVLSTLSLVAAAACSPQQEVDLVAERAELMAVDRAWADAYAASDSPADVFVAQVTEDATLLPPNAPLARGAQAIREAITDLEALPGFAVTWGPDVAVVGSGGDLGYTIGSYEMQMEGPDGPVTIQGKYLTVWQKQGDATWKVVADMFNANGPPASPEVSG